MNGNGWSVSEKLVMAELKRHSEWLRSIDGRLQELHQDVVVLKTKAAIWGAGAGAGFGALLAVLVKLLLP